MLKLGFPIDGKPILVAVSGGVDSMVLASMLLESGYAIAVAHCNYQLRGADSNADEDLVRNWCSERNVAFYLKNVNTTEIVRASKSSVQMVAREERYRFFEELMAEHGYVATAMAHHANDRVESLILNVLRGTGFRGLQGMPSKRDKFIRPLLGFTKDEIRTFAEEMNVPFREDASNSKTDYQRNWIRLRVLPMLGVYDSGLFTKLLQLCERVETEILHYESWVQKQQQEVATEKGISTESLESTNAPFTILKEMLEPFGFTSNHIFEVMEILDSDSGKEILSGTHRVVKDRDELLITKMDLDEYPPKLQFEVLDRDQIKSLKTELHIGLLNADKLVGGDLKQNTNYPLNEFHNLELRKWQQGDKFRPLGMNGWKLVSDFFIDLKMSVIEKDQVWLLTHQNEIVWIVGHRLDDRFKVTDSTQKVLKVMVHS